MSKFISNTIHKLINNKTEFINYLIFGLLATVVNISTYWILAHTTSLDTVTSNAWAVIISVVFAYITNKLFVFKSKRSSNIEAIKECIDFFLGRAFTGIIDTILLYIGVDILHINDVLMKLASSFIVVILNYIISKLIIFKEVKQQIN